MIGRRSFLAGATAATTVAVLPLARAAGDRDAVLRAMLDGLASLDSPAAKLKKLGRVAAHDLSPGALLDLEAAREGLAIDARIAAIMPFGRLGRSPYSVTPSSGAWRDLAAPDAADRIAADSAAIRAEAAAGIVLPRDALDRTITGLSTASAGASGSVAAALAEQERLLSSLAPRAGEPGVGRLPHGPEYFDLLIDRQFGGRDASAIHRRVLAKAQDVAAEADELLARLGYAGKTTGERFRAAFRDPRFLYADSEDGRDRAVADMNRWLGRARAQLPRLFESLPPECANVAVRRMTPVEEAAKKGGYRVLPTPDGTPGSYFVDLSDIRRRPDWSLASVVHHELLPGHIVQMPLDTRAQPHAIRTEYTAGFQEGWAIYAEELMARRGAFAGNDRARLGFLHWLMFRLCRSVIDTGVHGERWSIREARETLERMQGEPAFFATFDQDIQRVCLEPGARVGEALAWLALADRCGRGAATDLPRRHRAAIADGRLRLTSLDRRMLRNSRGKSIS
ncbi:DUF885 family protein [Sphingomonas asaccharolytica]|uniref:DUF885 family protein n=1 Tax=Sphingomonas asaccharolytica TaxID=40681 RepID=UPI000830FD33|nr:DUF885 family protein [Sphingomonas asaccharolytica]